MIYPIVAYGDPVLKKVTEDIEEGAFDLKELVDDMFETMYNANGVGLAAPQIGKSIRIFIVDSRELEEDDEGTVGMKKVFVNATIEEEGGGKWTYEEGCLSIPGVREDVKRNSWLKIHYFDENWVEHEERFDGIKARIIQHEYDHVEGVLFTDYLPGMKKRLIKKRLLNISKGKVDIGYRMKFPSK